MGQKIIRGFRKRLTFYNHCFLFYILLIFFLLVGKKIPAFEFWCNFPKEINLEIDCMCPSTINLFDLDSVTRPSPTYHHTISSSYFYCTLNFFLFYKPSFWPKLFRSTNCAYFFSLRPNPFCA